MRSKHSAKTASSASRKSSISPAVAASSVKPRLNLTKVIRFYEFGGELFNDAEDLVPSEFYDAPLGVLRTWAAPATSHAEALEALRLADTACEDGDDELCGAMLRAARLYFEEHDGLPLASPATKPHR